MEIEALAETFGICKVSPGSIPSWATESSFHFIARTPDELSVVCPESTIPGSVARDSGWRCLKVRGPLDLSLTGVLASLVGPLAEAGISVFAISTYDTDYLLVKELARAVALLRANGHHVSGARIARP